MKLWIYNKLKTPTFENVSFEREGDLKQMFKYFLVLGYEFIEQTNSQGRLFKTLLMSCDS